MFFLQSCYKKAKIQVQNNISGVRITDVYWGDFYLAYELLPGETSEKQTIYRLDQKLPASKRINFTMSANQKSVYLETQEYLLDQDDDLLIILSDDTKLKSTN